MDVWPLTRSCEGESPATARKNGSLILPSSGVNVIDTIPKSPSGKLLRRSACFFSSLLFSNPRWLTFARPAQF